MGNADSLEFLEIKKKIKKRVPNSDLIILSVVYNISDIGPEVSGLASVRRSTVK